MNDGHGDDIYKYGNKVKINFSSNIFAYADLEGLKHHISEHLDVIANYPEPQPIALENKLSKRLGLPRECVMVTNGSTEAIYHIAQMYRGAKSCIHQPTFSEYESACIVNGHVFSDKASIHWICNPNNPTGDVIPKEQLEETLKVDPDHIFIIDQAYEDYTTLPLFNSKEVLKYPNLILLHSFTKRYCVPGLRIGYVTAINGIIEKLREYQQPWSINAIAIEACSYLLDNDIPNYPDIDVYMSEAMRLRSMLVETGYIDVHPTNTTFMLAELKKGTANELKDFLIEKYGMLIRDASNFKGLNKSFFRVAAQRAEENDELVKAIKDYLR